jgi:putative Ca2+/H+ antiporter (TMEM165/GDT1 family)
MTDDWTPDPEPAGDLDPPRRRPPTAIGLLTPPPPRRPRRSVYQPSALRRRLAQAFLGAWGTCAGVATVTMASHPAAIIGGSLLALVGARLLGVSVRGGLERDSGSARSEQLVARKRAA